uniref:Protein kinase domain-containing protein n=1 Tax=Globisporangium ultimum (strain ATCC 200006 / CBS 805.95 / DAOM BR144) TaxID=431595 RepID=K3W8E7_GLOUD
MFFRLVTRLEVVSTIHDESESRLQTLANVTFRLSNFLFKSKSKLRDNPFPRFIASRAISSRIRDFHEELDHFTDFRGKELNRHAMWEVQWRKDRLSQQEMFQHLLRDDGTLIRGFGNADQQAEALFQLQYELRICQTASDADMSTQICTILNRIMALVEMTPPIVPEWFISNDDVDYQKQDSYEALNIYRGTWKKATVMVASSKLQALDFELRATQWFSLRHPNVVSLYALPILLFLSTSTIQARPASDISLILKKIVLSFGRNSMKRLLVFIIVINGKLLMAVFNAKTYRNGQAKVGGFEDYKRVWLDYRQSPEQRRGEVTASLASDIYTFGICILEATSDWLEAYVTRDAFGNGIIPEIVAGLSGGQWDLIVKMCAHEPQDRVNITYVVDQLKKLAANNDTTNGSVGCKANTASTE